MTDMIHFLSFFKNGFFKWDRFRIKTIGNQLIRSSDEWKKTQKQPHCNYTIREIEVKCSRCAGRYDFYLKIIKTTYQQSLEPEKKFFQAPENTMSWMTDYPPAGYLYTSQYWENTNPTVEKRLKLCYKVQMGTTVFASRPTVWLFGCAGPAHMEVFYLLSGTFFTRINYE